MSLVRFTVVFLSFALVAFVAATGDDRKPSTPDLPTKDPLLKEQWYLFEPQSPYGKPGSINAVGAWKLVRPAEPIVVALLDDGVNWTHPNLAPNIGMNPGEVRKDLIDKGGDDDVGGCMAPAIRSLNRKDDDNNGYVDDIVGWDFASNDYNPNTEPSMDDDDHGSMMAGLMAAVPTKKVGIAGAGRNLKIMPLRVVGDFQANAAVTIPAAIRYAVRNGARVIVTGLHIPPYLQSRKAFREAMDEAQNKGVLVVLAAMPGGDTSYAEEMRALAAYPNVLIVGCATKDGALLPLGDSHTVVKMLAPSGDMHSLSFAGIGHWKEPGVCPATALVAAAAATLLSQEPKLTPAEVIERMQKSARRHPSMDGKMKAGGSLDMEALLKTVRR